MRLVKFFVLMVVFTTWLWAGEGLKLVEKWQPGKETVGSIGLSIIDKDGDVVIAFFKSGNRLVKPTGIIPFAPRGQGPGDLMDMLALFPHNQDIGYVEMPGKIKIFKKAGDAYIFKEIVWYKRGLFPHFVKDGLYQDHKYLIAGYNILAMDDKQKKWEVSFIEVYDDRGKHLKSMINKTFFGRFHPLHDMDYHLASKGEYIFFLAENELKVNLISAKELEIKNEVVLKAPGFYKTMPKDYYTRKDYPGGMNEYARDVEHWKTSYSRIHKVLVEGDYLVLQMRTCDPKLKKFALLFYNADSFDLEKTVFTDDYLLGARAGRYYFFANGDPGRDEEAEDFVIHVCTLEK